MNELTVFNNAEFGSVRTMLINNEPWFVGKDVAEALGYGCGNNKSKALSNAINDHVDDEDKMFLPHNEFKGYQNGDLKNISHYGAYVINESGLYSLIMSSKLPSAKKFKRWVTSEVLPAIRKNGHYGTATNNVDLRALTEYLDFLKTDLENRKSSPSNIAYVIMDVSKQFGIDLPKDFEPRRKRLVEPQVESEPSTAFETTPEITASVNINYNLDSQCSVFAERLNKLLKDRNLKQCDVIRLSYKLAEEFGCSINRGNMSEWVNGKCLPTPKKALILSIILDCPWGYLYGFDER